MQAGRNVVSDPDLRPAIWHTGTDFEGARIAKEISARRLCKSSNFAKALQKFKYFEVPPAPPLPPTGPSYRLWWGGRGIPTAP